MRWFLKLTYRYAEITPPGLSPNHHGYYPTIHKLTSVSINRVSYHDVLEDAKFNVSNVEFLVQPKTVRDYYLEQAHEGGLPCAVFANEEVHISNGDTCLAESPEIIDVKVVHVSLLACCLGPTAAEPSSLILHCSRTRNHLFSFAAL